MVTIEEQGTIWRRCNQKEKKKKERKIACIVPSIRRWIMTLENDQFNILEEGGKTN